MSVYSSMWKKNYIIHGLGEVLKSIEVNRDQLVRTGIQCHIYVKCKVNLDLVSCAFGLCVCIEPESG